MSKSSSDNQSLDLSALDFGPAWARKGAEGSQPPKEYKSHKGERPDRGGKPMDVRRPRQGGRPPASGGGDRDFHSKPKFKRNDERERKPRPVIVPAAVGVKASIMPIEEGVDNMVKEIIASGRTYSVFDLARVVLGARERFLIVFKSEESEIASEKGPELLQSKHDGAVFLTKEECLNYAASAAWMVTIYKAEEIEVEPPSGEFQKIAKCGMSGELLGPTNFHGYQERVLELQRSKFSHMSLEDYKKRIVTESGDEVISQWKESISKRTIYKLVSDDAVVFDNKSAMLQHFAANEFATNFQVTNKAQVPSTIEAKKLSPSLLTSLKECIQEQRRYPGELSSFLCRQLSGRQLAVFKWQGKLHCGPSRPHVLPEGMNMADRPKTIYTWVSDHSGTGIDTLWKDVFPADIEEKTKLEWYHDLHWLINEGYVIFMNNGLLFPSSVSKKATANPSASQPVKKAKKKTAKKQVSTPKTKSEEKIGEPVKPKQAEAKSKDLEEKIPEEKSAE